MSKSADAQIEQQQAGTTNGDHLVSGGSSFPVNFSDKVSFLMAKRGFDYAGMAAFMQEQKLASFEDAVDTLYSQETQCSR